MGPEIVLPVYGLALLDTLSPATIGITVYLLLTAQRRLVRLLITYAATVAAFYFALGNGLMLGAGAFFSAFGDAVDSNTAAWIQLMIGVALFAGSWLIPTDRRDPDEVTSRASRAHTVPAMVVLGVTTGLAEAATAVPYLGAVGMMTAADIGPQQWIPLLAGYNLIMVAPVIILYLVWKTMGERARSRLEKIRVALATRSREALAWMIGIAGLMVAANAVGRLSESGGLDLFG